MKHCCIRSLLLLLFVSVGCHEPANSASEPDGTLWEDVVVGTGTIGEIADFKVGDLVPCPKHLAEFSLDIDATYDGNVFYRFTQTFCHYCDNSFDPNKELGMNSLGFTLTELVGGSLSGNHFYPKLAPESVIIRVNWNISREIDSQEFETEFDVTPKRNGSVKLGDKKILKWSFNPTAIE